MVPEARLDRVASGLAPVSPGWFVVNTAEAAWVTNDEWEASASSSPTTSCSVADPTDGVRQAGRRLHDSGAGTGKAGLYHAESVQEDFLILMGECLLVIEEQERHLRTWDFVHCPPMTGHTFVATGSEPCVILATGNRRDDHERVYPRSEVALRHGAGSEVTTAEPERRGRWEVKRPERWDELPWAGPAR